MQVGGSAGMKSDINVTPLIDVILVLLIIFMVITPVVQMGYLVKVPPPAPPNAMPTEVRADQIILRYMSDGRVFINKEQTTEAAFPPRLAAILKGNTGKMVFFAGDSDANYESTMEFLDKARAAGAHNIGIIVDELPVPGT